MRWTKTADRSPFSIERIHRKMHRKSYSRLICLYSFIFAISLRSCFPTALNAKLSSPSRHLPTSPFRNYRRAVGVVYAKPEHLQETNGNIDERRLGKLWIEQILKDLALPLMAKSSPPANPTYFHGYKKWNFYPSLDHKLELSDDNFPDSIQFFLCDSVFFDQNPFRTRQEIMTNCRSIRTYNRNIFGVLLKKVTGQQYGDANIAFEGANLENALPGDSPSSNRYRIAAVFDKETGHEVHIYPSPEIIIYRKNTKLMLKPSKSTTELINFRLLAERLQDFDPDGNHRLWYELKGTEGAETIQKLIPFVQIRKNTLLEACRIRDVAAVRVLLENGAASNERDFYTPMHFCCEKGYIEIISVLLEFGNIDQRNSDGKTPLHTAVLHNQLETGKFLIEKGAKINYRDFKGRTALYCAASIGAHEILEYLLAVGAEVETPSHSGMTPLLIAVERGEVRNVRTLLNQKASLRYRNHQRKNALFLACEKGSVEVVEELLAHRAPVDERGPDEYTPLMIATMTGAANVVDRLISYGADINAVNKQGDTALIISALKSYRNDVGILLVRKGALLDIQDEKMNTAFIYAVSLGFTQLAETLADHGANVNQVNSIGETALYGAIRSGRWESIHLCLSQGVDIHHLNHNGKSALDVAREIKNSNIYQMLLSYLSLMKLRYDAKIK